MPNVLEKADLVVIEQLTKRGKSATEIAKTLDASLKEVQTLINKNGWQPQTPKHLEPVRKLYENGGTTEEVIEAARDAGVDFSGVKKTTDQAYFMSIRAGYATPYGWTRVKPKLKPVYGRPDTPSKTKLTAAAKAAKQLLDDRDERVLNSEGQPVKRMALIVAAADHKIADLSELTREAAKVAPGVWRKRSS